jgi:hypothetical protein
VPNRAATPAANRRSLPERPKRRRRTGSRNCSSASTRCAEKVPVITRIPLILSFYVKIAIEPTRNECGRLFAGPQKGKATYHKIQRLTKT